MNLLKPQKNLFWVGMLGNVLDHYDMALYTFLVPFISPTLFPSYDPVMQIIMGYGVTSISILSRPIGSMIFGNMAIKIGARPVLFVTLTGVAISTCAIGLIPSYDDIGIWGGIILIAVRFFQGIFASGEQSIAGIFVLDQVKNENRPQISSYYQASSMTGAMMASGVAWLISFTGHGDTYWRYAFFSGLFTGIVGLVIRFVTLDITKTKLPEKIHIPKIFIKNWVIILRIIFVSSLSYMTFGIPFIFLNKFITILTDVTLTQMMAYNSIIMVLDIILLPIFGHITQKYNVAKWMICMTIILGISAIPAFYMLDKVQFYGIIAIKLWFVIIGIAISAPFRAWLYSLIYTSERYMITGFGYAVGTSILGGQTTTICWMLWHKTQNIIAPAYYIIALCILAIWALLGTVKQSEVNKG